MADGRGHCPGGSHASSFPCCATSAPCFTVRGKGTCLGAVLFYCWHNFELHSPATRCAAAPSAQLHANRLYIGTQTSGAHIWDLPVTSCTMEVPWELSGHEACQIMSAGSASKPGGLPCDFTVNRCWSPRPYAQVRVDKVAMRRRCEWETSRPACCFTEMHRCSADDIRHM